MNDRVTLWSRRIGGGVAAVLGLCMVSGCSTTGATQSGILAPRATQMGSFVPPPYLAPGQETKPVQASQLTSLWGPTPVPETAKSKPIPVLGDSLTKPLTSTQPPRGSAFTHRVKKGETLSQIAGLYKVSADQLASYNGMKKSDVLHVDRTLKIPPAGAAPEGVAKVTAAKEVKPHVSARTSSRTRHAVPTSGAHIAKPDQSRSKTAHQDQGMDSNQLQACTPDVKSPHLRGPAGRRQAHDPARRQPGEDLQQARHHLRHHGRQQPDGARGLPGQDPAPEA